MRNCYWKKTGTLLLFEKIVKVATFAIRADILHKLISILERVGKLIFLAGQKYTLYLLKSYAYYIVVVGKVCY